MITFAMVAMLALPPEQYDYEPTRPYRVEYVTPAGVEEHCPAPFGAMVVGCTVLDGYILLRDDLTPEAAAHVLRHEKGHVNGWNH